MKYLLDTNICIYIIKKKPPEVFARLRAQSVGEVGISTITCCELEYGVAHSSDPGRNRLALLEFLAPLELMALGPEIAPIYGEIRSRLTRAGKPIGPLDHLIAAHAISLKATLVTNNTREFARVPDLRVENWAQPVR